MIVKVTQKHIDFGIATSPWACPIAQAVNVRAGASAYVGSSEFNTRGRTYRLPVRARRFIRRFDRGTPVKPFTFRTLKGSK